MHLGLIRALLFAALGYLLAWLSEYSSIHTGIPFGLYHYIETTKGEELWVMGVPFMDSMSFVFLAYAGYSMALMVISPILYSRGTIYLLETKKVRWSWGGTILGALFFVYLDIIIDPVALQGGRWFLGQISLPSWRCLFRGPHIKLHRVVCCRVSPDPDPPGDPRSRRKTVKYLPIFPEEKHFPKQRLATETGPAVPTADLHHAGD